MFHQTTFAVHDTPRSADHESVPPLTDLLEQWVAEGIVTPEQAATIASREHLTAPGATRPIQRVDHASMAIEALGYLGGVVIVVGASLTAARFWPDIGVAFRLATVGTVALALLVGGFAIPDRLRDVGLRLRAVLWLASVAAYAMFLSILGADVFDLGARHVTLLTGVGTAALSAAVWALRRPFVLQAAMMVALMTTAAAVIALLVPNDDLPGLGVWAVAVVWTLLGWGGLLSPRRLVMGLGAAAATAGALLTMGSDSGIVLALATTAAIVSVGILFRDLALLAVGAFGALQILPAAVIRWFPDTVVAPFALLVLGLSLVLVAIWTARRKRVAPVETLHHTDGSRSAALIACAAVLVSAAIAVALIG